MIILKYAINKLSIIYIILLIFIICNTAKAQENQKAVFNLSAGISSGLFILEGSINDGSFNQFSSIGQDIKMGIKFKDSINFGLLLNYFFIFGNIEKGTEEFFVKTRYNRFDISVFIEKLFNEIFFLDFKIGTGIKIIMTRTTYDNNIFLTQNDRNGIKPGFIIGPGLGINLGHLFKIKRRLNLGLRHNYYRRGNRDDFYIGGFLEFQIL